MHASDVLRQTSPGSFAKLSQASSLILHHGWAAATVRHYAAAVNRFFSFMESTQRYPFPITSNAVYNFICWCRDNDEGSTVLGNTAKRYLTGLRMWHVLHDKPFPLINPHRVRLLFKASLSIEGPRKHVRQGMTLMDINKLFNSLDNSQLSLVLKAVLLVGFWGLARLGELTLHADHPSISVRRKDVIFGTNGSKATIKLRQAKTATGGEYQFLCLTKQPNVLDPVSILRRLLTDIPGKPSDPLFPGPSQSEPLRRDMFILFLKRYTTAGRSSLSGHSLRIGGASLRAHYGCSIDSLKKAGRWKSSCYQLYIRKYSKKTAKETVALAKALNKTL